MALRRLRWRCPTYGWVGEGSRSLSGTLVSPVPVPTWGISYLGESGALRCVRSPGSRAPERLKRARKSVRGIRRRLMESPEEEGRAAEQALGDANKLRAGALLGNPSDCKIFVGCDSFHILRMGHNICTFLQMKLEDFFRQRRLRLKMLISRNTKINGDARGATVRLTQCGAGVVNA